MIIKDFLPPILLQLSKTILGFGNSKKYASYNDALKDCSTYAYQDEELCNMIADKTLIYKEKLKEMPYKLNPTSIFLVAAINQYINNYSKSELVVLDFGGASGAHYFEVKRFLPKGFVLKWFVVETKQMVKSAIEKGIGSEELFFVSAVEDITLKIDFIHSSSTLQYVDTPYDMLKILISVKADQIFFNRMMFNKNNTDIITIQKSHFASNGPGEMPSGYSNKIISYPHTTMSYDNFNATILNNNYKQAWIFEEPTGSFDLLNANILGRGLLYSKTTP